MNVNYYNDLLEKEGALSDNFDKCVRLDTELRDHLIGVFKSITVHETPVEDGTIYWVYSLTEDQYKMLKKDGVLRHFISSGGGDHGRLVHKGAVPEYSISFVSTDGIQNNIKDLFLEHANIIYTTTEY